MLKRGWAYWIVLLWLLSGSRAQSAQATQGVQLPVRLTAGSSNQWMGVIAPDGKSLYFVSDQNATAEIYVQHPVDSGPRLLFEHNADVSWPRISPDGSQLAFISYKADATGDACVRNLFSQTTRCLTGLASSEMQVTWLPDGNLAVLMRGGMHKDYVLQKFSLQPKSQASLMLKRNMLGVDISKDGHWLAYVPLVRTQKRVGVLFSNRSDGLSVVRWGSKAKPIRYKPPLPGITGFPAFGADDRWLYFSQYLNDTNQDGVIDGNDHSVLFRVRFSANSDNPIATTLPEQLTSARWNCRYAYPTKKKLVLTCSHKGSLDIYALPPDGAVPITWDRKRITEEIEAARDNWTQLLLLARLLYLETKPKNRLNVLRQITALHLDNKEFESAEFYCHQIHDLANSDTTKWKAWSSVLRELIRHRREDVRLTHGQLSESYIRKETRRIGRLSKLLSEPHSLAKSLAMLTISEIQDDIGETNAALETFSTFDWEKLQDAITLRLAAQRAQRLYQIRGQRTELAELYASLAQHASLSTAQRLEYAELFVHELVRGIPEKKRANIIQAARQRFGSESELGLMLHVTHWLLRLRDQSQQEVRQGIFDLYKKTKDVNQRRALVLATIRTANRLGKEYLAYQFATSWASWLRRAHPERKYAEQLYRQIVLERAYEELGRGEIAKARGTFFQTTVQTQSLEAHIGFMEAWIQEGKGDPGTLYDKQHPTKEEDPIWCFAKAYLIARGLSDIVQDQQHQQQLEKALELLEGPLRVWPRAPEIHHLRGTIWHQHYLRTGDTQAASSANKHYLLAIDLAASNMRLLASLYMQVGLLQASLGNHRIALSHYTQRAKMPHVRPITELSLQLATARSLYFENREIAALSMVDQALRLCEKHQSMARFKVLVLDRRAFYFSAAGKTKEAIEAYKNLLSVYKKKHKPNRVSNTNLLKTHLQLAALFLSAGDAKRSLSALDSIDGLLEQNRLSGGEKTRQDYVMLARGFRTQAHRQLGEYALATAALRKNRDRLFQNLSREESPDILSDLARTSLQLAELAYRQKEMQSALTHIERGLSYADRFAELTGSSVTREGLSLLAAYAELHLYANVPLTSYNNDLRGLIDKTYTYITTHPSPSWEQDRYLFEIYLTMLEVS